MAKVQKNTRQSNSKNKKAKLEKIKLNAAGIDIGAEKIYIAIIDQEVKEFKTFTSGINKAISYLKSYNITSVALEATGIYWFPIYEAIEEAGIEIYVVNGAHVKNVPGKKSDVLDSEWLRELHSYGLLRSSFVPQAQIRKLRYYLRLRNDFIRDGARHVQHIQKNFDAMNIKLHNVISDIMGESGQKIICAILNGERNPGELLKLCKVEMQKNKGEDIIKSLEGNYREEYIFGIKQAYEMWKTYQQKITECDTEIEKHLQEITKDNDEPENLSHPKRIYHHKPEIQDFHYLMMKMTGNKDATKIAGINDYNLLKLVSETGLDLSCWPTEKHFTSWCGLSPSVNKSGKTNKKSRRQRKKVNEAGEIFKQIALNVGKGKHCALSGFYRRIKSRSGALVANKATARKIAVYYYNLMTKGFEFVEEGLNKYEERYNTQRMKALERKANEMGMKLVSA